MARESQGLQVLFIGSIMLSVALGVSLYLSVQKAGEASKSAAAETHARQQAEGEKKATEEENKDLKAMIGLRNQSTEEIKKQFAEDMQVYANGRKVDPETGRPGGEPLFDSGTLFYSRLLAGMYKTIQERTGELIQARAGLADLRRTYQTSEAAKDNQINVLVAGYAELEKLVQKVFDDYRSGQKATAAQMDEIAKTAADIRKNSLAAAGRAADAEKLAKQEREAANAALQGVLDHPPVDGPKKDLPAGEITGVSLATKAVWINRGRADGLPEETRFTVYAADANNAMRVKKGTICVTRIDGEHSAQARIVEDKVADPFLVGDKLFTRFWSPGKRVHFALSGIMNLDGDGHNKLNIVRGIISMNGGAVDCWLDEQGHKQGQITADTRYLVVGDAPDKSLPEFMKNSAEIVRDAEQHSLRKLTLSDFKQRMGDAEASPLEHF